jgi:hypothetical protein
MAQPRLPPVPPISTARAFLTSDTEPDAERPAQLNGYGQTQSSQNRRSVKNGFVFSNRPNWSGEIGFVFSKSSTVLHGIRK